MVNIKDLSVKFFTNNECLSKYLNDIRKFKVMTAEEEKEAFSKLDKGDAKARESIINCNQRFVFSLAKRYAKNEDEVLDYVNEGNIGLMEAIGVFDASKGYKFITFAVWYIQRAMNYYFTVTNQIVKQPNAMKIGKKVSNIKEKAYATTGNIPTNDEIIEILKNEYGIVIKDKVDIAEMGVESINEEVSEDYEVSDTSDFNEVTASHNLYEDDIENEAYSNKIQEMLESIPESLSTMLKMYFGVGYMRAYTVEEIAEKMSMYKGDVDERIKKTLAYLQQEYGSKLVG